MVHTVWWLEEKNKTKIKIISKFYILKYIYTHKSSGQSFETNFLQENGLIPYYSADQRLVKTDNPQHSDKNGGKN